MGFKFAQAETGGGEFFSVKDLAANGHRVLVRPTAFVPNKNFGGHFTADSLEADVVDLDTNTAWYQVDIKNSVPMKAFKELLGELLLVRFSFGRKQVQGNPVVLFENLNDSETVGMAEVYLTANPGFQSGDDRLKAQAEDNSAPSAPKQDTVAQAAAAFSNDVKKMARSVFESLPADAQQQVLATGVQVEG